MKQLGVLDTAFVNLEHPNTPQHVGGMGIYDPSTAPGGFVRFKGVIANFERRLKKHSIFRSRLVNVPGKLDRPYWVQDANFDVEFHIRHLALPQPGDWRQLCILIARLHARPLDMSRPLWEAYIIEGLDNIPGVPKGGFAIYTKMHHSLVDGAGGSSIMSVIHDLEPDPEAVPEAPETVMVDIAPSPLYLGTATAVNQLKNSVKMLGGAANTLADLGKLAWGVARKRIPMPSITSPRTRFNTPVGPYRVFEAAEFSLEDVKLVKNHSGVKINDVVLSVVGGAMRKYLQHHNELPEDSLAVSIPLNMRTRRGVSDENNQVGSVFVEVHTELDDPLARLKAIYQSSQDAKAFGENSPLVDVLRLAGVMPPAMTRPIVNTYVNNELTQHLPLGISSVVSNVAGPPFPLYSAGAQMVRYYGLGLLTPGVGLFHLVFSSSGVVTMSILGDRDSMPDPAFYRECVEKAFQELLDAVKADISKQEAEAKKPKARKKAPAKKAVKKAGSGAVAKAPVKKARAASTKASSTKSATTAKRSRASSGAAEPVESILKPEAEVSSGAASNVVSLSAESGK
ncbi:MULTISPECIES: WS/DGAT/MGAT family O-acyltransferase [unclassified Spongiibacter]|uniref:WS/DGAT/MGAT family O-acyltransferase n=1 Tax=Spongiibacter TaxID=630749 RepID=UPI000C0B28C0|nr:MULTISPECIES: wax ester/triacylglycerol synthase family O-acyltransferase [unclassified Spongiibacter]MAK44577.1 wax ester/triacylglycerol synthase family O-acyltransferase [Spongiibacter sp.]|tara:strand:+ start:2921 stop:4624 length:1704 start_codon:yes stop_codon:yes gene_type:complete